MSIKLIEGAALPLTKPGLYRLTTELYHKDPCPTPSLSSSIGKLLLSQSPKHAFAKHPKLGGADDQAEEKPTRAQEIGTATHRLLLGFGSEVVEIDADNYTTKAAKDARAAAYAEGKAPILKPDLEAVVAMSMAFQKQLGAYPPEILKGWQAAQSEVVLAWQERGGLWARAMLDKVLIEGGRAVIYDLKTTSRSADPYTASRTIFDGGYDFQAAFYRRGLKAVCPEVLEVKSRWVFQENEPPYALSVVELGYEGMASADKEVWKALALWERCLKNDDWPGYTPIVATADLPSYIENRRAERELNDAMIGSLDLAAFAPRAPERKPRPNLLAAG